MKIRTSPANRAFNQSGFTLIEMIGVLAVIAILAAVLIPKVFEAINNARVNNAAMTINSVKTACIDHYAKYGTFPVDGVANAQLTPPVVFDPYLVKEGLMDKPFVVKIGDGLPENPSPATPTTSIVLVSTGAATQLPDGTVANEACFDLDGDGGTTSAKNDAAGTWVVMAIITGVQVADAQALNKAIDGSTPQLGEVAGNDFGGRVVYKKPANPGDPVTVYVYLTHR